MKLVGVISTAVLSLTLGVAAPAYAQQEQHEQQEEQKAKPAQPEEKKAQPEKSAKQEEKPAAQQEKNTKQAEKNTQPEEKSTKQEEKSAPQQEKNAKQQENNAKQEDKNTKSTEKNAQQHPQQAQPAQQAQRAGGNDGGRIPEARFQANFGREHTFRVSQADYSNHRFQYGGYWFGFADAWPSNWLYTQDVFVVDINGVYYLCNPMYPGVNIALTFAP